MFRGLAVLVGTLAAPVSGCGHDEAVAVDAAVATDSGAPDGNPDSSPDSPDASNTCAAGTRTCDRDTNRYIGCSAEGTVEIDTICGITCFDEDSCAEIVASNGLSPQMFGARTAPDIVFTGTSTLDTTNGTAASAGSPVTIPTEVVGGIRVFMVHSLRVEGTLRATGSMPLAIVAYETVVIDGLLDASSDRAGLTGPGSGTGCAAASDVVGDAMTPGGGGGGHISVGAHGGAAGDGTNGGVGGTVRPHARGIPLVGGCRGADVTEAGGCRSSGGAGGGAVQISARVSLRITDTGRIDASGAGGSSRDVGTCSSMGGGGGGSGGLVLLETWSFAMPQVTTMISVTGGGGAAAGNGCATCNGADGAVAFAHPTGGTNTGEASGGRGGLGDFGGGAGHGDDATTSNGDGGGGGGGFGAVQINEMSTAGCGSSYVVAGNCTIGSPGSQLVPP